MEELQSVGIIGGGMGGLLLARLIKLKCGDSVSVTVYERDETKDSRDQGYLLGIDDTGMNALQKVLPDVYNYRSEEASKGFNLTSSMLKKWITIKMEPGMGISRRKLRALLMEGIIDNDIQFGKKFLRCEEKEGKVIAYFEDGSLSPPFDLLIGADGARSRVRANRIPSLKYEPIGVVSVTGSSRPNLNDIPSLNHILDGGFTRVFGPKGSSVLLMKFNDNFPNEILWVITIPLHLYPSFPHPDQEKDFQLLFEWSKDHIKSLNYHNELNIVLNSTEISSLAASRELYSIVPIKKENPLAPSSRVTLLGDSAHSMTTHRGRGANTTFEDCLDLCDFIDFASHNRNWLPALHKYEKILFKRGFKNVIESKQSSNMITMTGFMAIIRNFIIRFIGLIVFIRSIFV